MDISQGGRWEDGPYAYQRASEHYSPNVVRLDKLKYTHEAMIDLIIAEPTLTHIQISEKFGYAPGWVGRVISSDAFQTALAARRREITDPFLVASLEERFKGLAVQSIEIITRKLEQSNSADLALKGLDIATKALGFGARDRGQTNVQNNFVVQMPEKAQDAQTWAKNHNPVIEAQPLSSTVSRDPFVQPKPMKIAEESDVSTD